MNATRMHAARRWNRPSALRALVPMIAAALVLATTLGDVTAAEAKGHAPSKRPHKSRIVRRSHKSTSAKRAPKQRSAPVRPRTARRRPARTHPAPRLAHRASHPDKLALPQGDGSPVLALAAGFLGRPYRFGAAGWAYDCSGFVRTVFGRLGIDLPHSAREQFAIGDRISRDALEPGDLVFFRTYRRAASHVGIYVGEDRFIHAATRGGQVQVDSLNQIYYARRYLGARRLDM
jgi:cell wall-associated NlpC family hydrolase